MKVFAIAYDKSLHSANKGWSPNTGVRQGTEQLIAEEQCITMLHGFEWILCSYLNNRKRMRLMDS
jgi:hypothetical protein